MTDNDTIGAISTAFGEGAVALVRISGQDSVSILDRVFAGPAKPAEMDSRRAYLGTIRTASGDLIDEALVTVFRGPSSYTGEDVAEIACHGGIHVTRRVLDVVLEAGARAAEPGEFTQRAFLNGRMDLTQAEAVMDLIRSQSDLALASAQAQLSGGLGCGLEAMRQELLGILAHLEAYIDFPDEGIDPETGQGLVGRVSDARSEVQRLLGTADRGRIMREGVATVLCGAPNVGKSSLLNALSGRDRAIVSEIAGTTRDTVEETLHIGGLVLRLIDTAGLRKSDDVIEREGIDRTHRAVDEADLVLEVFDASLSKAEQPGDGISSDGGVAILRVLNKADLEEHSDWSGEDGIRLSCQTGKGIPELVEAVTKAVHGGDVDLSRDPVAINARHQACLRRAEAALGATIQGLNEDAFTELVAIELRTGLDAIGEVVGKADSEDLLGEIFANFCIGK